MPVHGQIQLSPTTRVSLARTELAEAVRSIENVAAQFGAELERDLIQAKVVPKLAQVGDELKALYAITCRRRPVFRRSKLNKQIARHVTEVAILAGQINQAIGAPNAHEDSNQTQPPREGEAGQDPSQERPDERD